MSGGLIRAISSSLASKMAWCQGAIFDLVIIVHSRIQVLTQTVLTAKIIVVPDNAVTNNN